MRSTKVDVYSCHAEANITKYGNYYIVNQLCQTRRVISYIALCSEEWKFLMLAFFA